MRRNFSAALPKRKNKKFVLEISQCSENWEDNKQMLSFLKSKIPQHDETATFQILKNLHNQNSA